MPRVATGGEVPLSGYVGRSNGFPADAPDLTLTIVGSLGTVAGFPVAIPPIVRDDLGRYHYDWSVPADLPIGDYTATWEGSVDGAPAGGSETVEVVTPGAVAASFVPLADIRALVKCKQTDSELQTILDREEGWLADRVGPLAGSRIQTFYLPAEREQFYIEPSGYAVDRPRLPYPYMIRDVDAESPLTLFRQADTVSAVTDGGATVTARLLSMGWKVEKTTGPWLGPSMAVTYTPTDAGSVAKVVIELVRMTVLETGFIQERIGDYMYSRRAGNIEPVAANEVARMALVRTLLYPTNIPRTMRLRSSALSERIGAPLP